MPAIVRVPVRRLAVLSVAVLIAAGCDDGNTASVEPSVVPSTTSTEAPTTTSSDPPTTTATTEPAPDGAAQVEILRGTEIEAPAPHRAVLTRLEGTMTGDVVWALPQSIEGSAGVAIGWFEGEVAGCGHGGVGMAAIDDASGAVRWEVLRGTGTGVLEQLSASGTGSWALDTDAGSLTGTATCDESLDPSTFETALVDPPSNTTPMPPVFGSEVLYGSPNPFSVVRLAVDPDVLPHYPGITLRSNLRAVDPIGAVLTSASSNGIGSVFVGRVDQPSGECPGGTRSVIVQPNFDQQPEIYWQHQPVDGCGDDDSGAWGPKFFSTDPSSSTTSAPAAPAAPAVTSRPMRAPDAGPFDVRFSWGGGIASTGYYDPELHSSTFEGGGLTGDVAGGGTAVGIDTAGIGPTSMVLHWFEGEVAGCGSGTMVIRYGSSRWEIVPGMGTGDLATVTGHGFSAGSNRSRGVIDCHGLAPGERPAFATTLLTPPVDGGTEAPLPSHIAQRQITHTIPSGADGSSPSPLTLTFTEYQEGARMISVTATAPAGSTGPLKSTMIGVWLGPTTCGDHSIARLVVDDILSPTFAGAWDLAPGLNGDASGGGPFVGPAPGPGRVDCGTG